MAKFLFDGTDLCTKHISGVSRYAYEVLQSLDTRLVEEKSNLDISLCYPEGRDIILPNLKKIRICPLKAEGQAFRTKVLKKYAKVNRAVVCTLGPSICYMSGMIITIHDVRPIDTKEYDTKQARRFMNLVMLSCRFMHATIVTDALYQKERIINKGRIKEGNINVFGCGWEHIETFSNDDSVFDKFPAIKKNEYFYSLGSVAKHKNYQWIYEVAKRNPDKQFVVAGNISEKDWGIDDSGYRQHNVVFVGFVTDEENKSLMSHCSAFIQPSKYEGFGIPPLEAIALEKKVMVSNATCLPEIYGEYIKPFDPDDYELDLEEYLSKDQSNSSKLLLKYTWQNVANGWYELLMYRNKKAGGEHV